jgi:glycosyltransferase involved in cell wall biosynthesis
MPHGMLDPYFQKASGRKLKAIRNLLYWKLIEQKLINDADGLLFTCVTEMELARQPFRPYKPKREIVVGLGTEAPPVYTPAMTASFREKCPAVQQYPYILFLSRIHEKKGVDLLIHSYDSLRRHYSDPPKLVIAGPGLDSTYGLQMQTLANAKGLTDHTYFPGMLSAFYGCEAFVLPSHQENFGIAVVEAMACAKPVLISNQVNIWQEIQEASAGLVAEDNTVGCQQLLENWFQMSEDEKGKMGVNAKACYNNNFAMEPAAKRLLAAIQG